MANTNRGRISWRLWNIFAHRAWKLLKSTFRGLHYCRWRYGSIFIRESIVAGSFLHPIRGSIPPTFVRNPQLHLLITHLIPHRVMACYSCSCWCLFSVKVGLFMQQQVLFLLVMYMSLQCHQSLSVISCISPAHFMLFCFYHRSSKVTRSSIYLGANRKRIHVCNFLLIINSNRIYITVFEIFTHDARNSLFYPPHSCLTQPLVELVRIFGWKLNLSGKN